MSLKPISEAEARRLILNGTAGYWSIHTRSVPIPNERQTILRLDGQLFIVPASEMEVHFVAEVGVIGGRAKGAFAVTCGNEEILALAKKEMERKGVFVGPEGMMETPGMEKTDG